MHRIAQPWRYTKKHILCSGKIISELYLLMAQWRSVMYRWCLWENCSAICGFAWRMGGGLQEIEMLNAEGLLFSGWVQSLMVYQKSTSGHISTRLEVETEHPQSVNLILCVRSHILPSYLCVGYEMQLGTLWNHGVFYEIAWSYRSLSFVVYLSLSPLSIRGTQTFLLWKSLSYFFI